MHADNRKKDILVLGEDPTDRLDDTTITAETKYFINIANPLPPPEFLFLSLSYNGRNSLLYANGVENVNSKQEIKKQYHIHCV